jgi:signal peptidase I
MTGEMVEAGPRRSHVSSGGAIRRRAFGTSAPMSAIVLSGLLVIAAAGCSTSTTHSEIFFTVPSLSMKPTLQPGDRIAVVPVGGSSPSPVPRGAVVVFREPAFFPCAGGAPASTAQDVVKRVIGMPGETIWSVGNAIFVDGKKLPDQGWYWSRYAEIGPTPITRQTIPANDYFVLGDNRTDSCDSRMFGPIAKSLIVGEVVAVVTRDGNPVNLSV